MIKSFKCKESEKIFNHTYSHKLPPQIQKIALRKLYMINAAVNLSDLKTPPSNHLKKLKGGEKKYSIRINKQWRICFKWLVNTAYDLEIIDYH